jgi:hypothetical protein
MKHRCVKLLKREVGDSSALSRSKVLVVKASPLQSVTALEPQHREPQH